MYDKPKEVGSVMVETAAVLNIVQAKAVGVKSP
jgi:hypothetical protein